MRILMTGATGYFGGHVLRTLAARGHAMGALKRRSSRTERLEGLVPEASRFDLEDGGDAAVRAFRPDAVVHMATCYGRRGEGPLDVFEANVAGPLRLLAALDGGLFVNTDTSLPPDINPYARSKRQFAEWCRILAEQGRARVLNVRLESVYGPGDDDTKFTTQLLRTLLRNVPRFPMTPGDQARDFIHVEDAAEAFALLLEHAAGEAGTAWIEAGLGSGRATTIREFSETLRRLAGADTELAFGALSHRPNEMMRAEADIALLARLGWKGSRPLEQGLRETVAVERGS